MSAFGGARQSAPKPPEKGVFPLDHFGECKLLAQKYLKCVQENTGSSEPCREISKMYLICRMDKNLMSTQDLRDLGFKDAQQVDIAEKQQQQQQS
jgi:cytochrome c oxidase assembly protein subunit 19